MGSKTIVQNETKSFQNAIDRFIRIKINGIGTPPDMKFALDRVKKRFEEFDKWFEVEIEMKNLYDDYRAGDDVMSVLNSNEYNKRFTYAKYPSLYRSNKVNLIETQKQKKSSKKIIKRADSENLEAFADIPTNNIIFEEIPEARKEVIKHFRKYVAFMELKRRVDESGLDKIEVASEIVTDSDDENDDKETLCYFKDKKNLFNKVPLEQVYKYFMQLAEELDAPFLTKADVLNFVDKAFCKNDNIEKLTFSNTNGKKGIIWKLFYNFFIDCYDNTTYEAIKAGKKKYVQLLIFNLLIGITKQYFLIFQYQGQKIGNA